MPLGGFHIFIDQEGYDGYKKLTNQSVEVGRNLSVSKTEENCLQVSFPSTMSVNFCEKKEMLSFVVTPADVYKNTTKGLLGTWNDDPDDDFTLPDGTVLSSSSTLREIHFGFGVKCNYISTIFFFIVFYCWIVFLQRKFRMNYDLENLFKSSKLTFITKVRVLLKYRCSPSSHGGTKAGCRRTFG